MKEQRIQEIFEHLEEINIDLAYDPIQKGPKFLNGMVAKCRNTANKVQKYEREVARAMLTYERQLSVTEAGYELQYNDLMTNDPEVANQPSAKDREAMVNNKLRDMIQEIQELKARITDMKHVRTVVQSKLNELRDINRDLRLQIKLVEDEIQIGNAWGDQSGQTNDHIGAGEVDLNEVLPATEGYDPSDAEGYEELFGASPEEVLGEFEAVDAEEFASEVVLGLDKGEQTTRHQVLVVESEDEEIDLSELLKDI